MIPRSDVTELADWKFELNRLQSSPDNLASTRQRELPEPRSRWALDTRSGPVLRRFEPAASTPRLGGGHSEAKVAAATEKSEAEL
jgi:hypothetical protein